MEIAALKTILQIQAHSSISAAARALEVDPSSVSRTLATVEAELGLRLFHRTTRRLAVTEAGEAYLRRVAPLVDEIDAAREEAAGARTAPQGRLRLTASVAFSAKVLVPVLQDFQDRYPKITVELQSSDANLDLLQNGIDLAIRLTPAPKGDLVSSRLMHTRYRVVASPELAQALGPLTDPRALEAVTCLRYALPGLQDRWRFQRPDHPAFDVPVSGGGLFSNALALREAALLGQGVALLADWLIDADVAAGRLVPLVPDHAATLSDFDTAAWMLYPNRSHLPRKVRVMIDHLRQSLGRA